MKFTARIPKKILFTRQIKIDLKTFKSTRNNLSFVTNKKNKIPKLFDFYYNGPYWAIDSKAEEQSFLKNKLCGGDPNGYLHENSPCELELVSAEIGPYTKTKNFYVSTTNGYLVKMPKDIFINSLLTGGFKKNNRTLPGKYIFSLVNSGLVPIQVGSDLHKTVIAHIAKKKVPILSVKEFYVGQAYTTNSGKTGIFLGYVNTETINIKFNKEYEWDNRNALLKPADVNIKFNKKKLNTLWYEFNLFDYTNKKRSLEEINKKFNKIFQSSAMYNFSCQKSHSYTKPVPGYNISMPTDIVFTIKRNASNYCGRFTKDIQEDGGITRFHINNLSAYANLCNMSLFGTGFYRSEIYDVLNKYKLI